jgi:PPM family protein phosphatase
MFRGDATMNVGARSDTGRIRENNEDSFRLSPELDLYVLSDGMGGQAAGEVASRLATETIVAHCRAAKFDPSLPLIGQPLEGVSAASNRLASAIRLANREIAGAALRTSAHRGMGATIVAVWFNESRMTLAHVGDSRAYRLRGGAFEQLTKDHSYVAEQVRHGIMSAHDADTSTMQSVLLRALGAESDVEIDVDEQLVLEGDTFLLCSDGLTRELSDAQIAAVLFDVQDPEEAADQLVNLANQAGGGDNITVVVLLSRLKQFGGFKRLGRFFRNSS